MTFCHVLPIVKTKQALIGWVHTLRSKNPVPRAQKDMSSTAKSSADLAPVVPPLQLPAQVSSNVVYAS